MRTIVPNRFRQEPLDAAAYDAWQDGEGLADASDQCRAAWTAFKPQWRAARKLELAHEPEQHRAAWDAKSELSNRQQFGKRRAVELGGRFGLVDRPAGSRPLSDHKRAAYWRWRSRIMRHDPSLWGALWCLLDGQGSGLVAARLGRKAVSVERAARTALGWLTDELYPQVVT